MRTKKTTKNTQIKTNESPQEFLAGFNDLWDKKFIKEAEKEMIYDLYNTALKVPTGLRSDINEASICLSPAPVKGESEYEKFRNWLNIQISILDLLSQTGVINKYKLKNRYDKSIEQIAPPNDMVFADVKFFPSDVISYYEDYQKAKEPIYYKTNQEEPSFDGLNRVIRFGYITYSFQKTVEGQRRLDLFKTLWDERRTIKNRQEKKQGLAFPPETVATRIGIIDSPHTFLQRANFPIREKFKTFIKNLNTNLRRKKLPIKISRIGGIQIVIKI